MLEQFSVLVPLPDSEDPAATDTKHSATRLIGGLRTFIDLLQDHVDSKFQLIPLLEWEPQSSEYVFLDAGPDPVPALELWDHPQSADVFQKIIPLCCGPGQGIQAMQRFPLPGFIESSGFVRALNHKRPTAFSGLITRIETARRLGFDCLESLHGMCAVTVAESLPKTLAEFLHALQA